MSIIQDYVADRRKKKIEDVTHALEQLKHENVATDSLKPRHITPTPTYTPMKTGKDLLFIGILLVAVIVLVVLTFYYRSQYNHLNQDYQEKVAKLETLKTDLEKNITDLKETQATLEDKKQSEKELSGKSKELQGEIDDLQGQIDTLEADIKVKNDEVINLTKTMSDQKSEISKWKSCIRDEYNGNLSIC